MTTTCCRTLVHRLVAAQLRIDVAGLRDDSRFDELGLDSLNLVMVVLMLEDLEIGQTDFPLHVLDRAETVGDLVLLVELWLQTPTVQSLSGATLGASSSRSTARAPAGLRQR